MLIRAFSSTSMIIVYKWISNILWASSDKWCSLLVYKYIDWKRWCSCTHMEGILTTLEINEKVPGEFLNALSILIKCHLQTLWSVLEAWNPTNKYLISSSPWNTRHQFVQREFLNPQIPADCGDVPIVDLTRHLHP